jgi:F-type H+-transporting ATPase subunit delta
LKDARKISRRYAQALMGAIQDRQADTLKLAEQTANVLSTAAEAFKNNPDVTLVFSNPAISSKDKESFILNFAKDVLKADDLTVNFFKVLSQNSRVLAINEIAKEFAKLVAGLKQALILDVSAAYELPETEKKELLAKLQTGIKSELTVNWHVDSSLLGGLVVRAGDRVFDGSLQASLSKAKELLLS